LKVGVDLMLLRGDSLRRASFTPEQVVLLMWVDLGAILLGQWTEHSSGSEISTRNALAQLMPLLLVPAVGYVALSVVRQKAAFLRLAGGFCAALPSLIALWFLAANLKRIGATRLSLSLEVIIGFWGLTVALVIIGRLSARAGSLRRWATCAIFLLPWAWAAKHGARETVWRFVPSFSSYRDDARRLPALVFAQADLTRKNVAALRAGRPGVDDLYFIGLAGWGSQDVFGKEVRFAQHLFDERFDTRGRSLVVINDASAHDAVPMATEQTLARTLMAVGELMDRDEDVLFLFLTSHGSKDGVAIEVPDAPELRDDLSPDDLRSLLDEARIKWRVLMVSACESGVFVGPLQNPFTLIATAAAADRKSFGCANGAEFTEFGRAVLKEQLVEQRSFESAFRKAADVIAQREKEKHLEASLPQLFVGEAIAAKLSTLEARLTQVQLAK
jgi:hypothetical protein